MLYSMLSAVFHRETGTFVWSITERWHDWASHLDINISTESDNIGLNINMNLNRSINRYWCPIDSSLNETFIKTQQAAEWCIYEAEAGLVIINHLECFMQLFVHTVHSNHGCTNIDSVRPWTMNGGATANFVGVYLFMQAGGVRCIHAIAPRQGK